ncbi:MAG: hypothetical protein ABGY21_06150, partial [Pseudomonadota bacterium]
CLGKFFEQSHKQVRQINPGSANAVDCLVTQSSDLKRLTYRHPSFFKPSEVSFLRRYIQINPMTRRC